MAKRKRPTTRRRVATQQHLLAALSTFFKRRDMKHIDDLNDEELLALTPDEIDRYVDLACAEAGIKLLPEKAPQPPKMDSYVPDQVLWSIGGLVFFKKKDADKVRAALVGSSLANVKYVDLGSYRTDYSRRTAVPEHEIPTIHEVQCFSEELAARCKSEFTRINEEKEDYEKRKREYDQISNQRAEIRQRINNQVYALRKQEERRQSMLRELDRYLVLADHNMRVALRFLQSAHPEAPTVLPDKFPVPDADPNDPNVQAAAVVGGLQELEA